LNLGHLGLSATASSVWGILSVPNKVVRDSEASKNSLVDIALSFSLSTGTSVNDLLMLSRKVPPGGYALVDAIVLVC
jgi:hypothetical protein